MSGRRYSVNDDNPDLALAPGYRCRHLAAESVQHDIRHRIAEAQPAYMQMLEKTGQHRLLEADLAGKVIEFQPEARLNQREHRGAGPGLRRASDRIHRRRGMPAGEAAE